MFFIGALVSLTCLFIAYYIFQTSIGLFTSLFVTIAMTPFMLNLVRYEEDRDEQLDYVERINFAQRHRDILKVYSAFFVGMTLCLALVFIALPQSTTQNIFKDQIAQINAIRANVAFADTFQKILVNNIGVLSLSFLFSFLFGAGAVFILAWNASVLAAAIGMAAQQIGGLKGLPFAILVFFPHGSLEILAYFIAGIAGGLVSTVVLRRHTNKFWFVVKDSVQLMVIAGVLLVAAAFIESMSITL